MNQLLTDFILKYKPWGAISYLCKIPFITPMIQHIYYNYYPNPNSVKIHINTECNYNCIYCYSSNFSNSIPLQAWLGFIDRLSLFKIQTVEISGGEPFLYKDLFKILKKCSENNYQITIYTNGSLVNEEWIKKLKSLNTSVVLSVKYDLPSLYHTHTNNYDARTVEENIRILVRNRIPVVAFITATKQNIKEMNRIINRAIGLGALPAVERYLPIKSPKINKKLSITNREWSFILSLIKKVYHNYRSLIDGVNRIQGRTCSCFISQFSVMQNGDVIPCQFLPISTKIGNIIDDSIEDIWVSLRSKRKDWLKIPDECKHCKNRLVCKGGCRTSAYYKYGKFSKKDPLCYGIIPTTLGHAPFIIIHNYKTQDLSHKQLNLI